MSSWGNRIISPTKINRNLLNTKFNINNITDNIPNTILFNKDIAFNNTYDETIKRIDNFNENNTNKLITFIIPTINRISLHWTLLTLLNQTINNWNAILIFDGCEPIDKDVLEILSDNRFIYICINKLGRIKDKIHGSAGFVRNIGMSLVKTPWIAFLDDDDNLLPNYVEALIEELKITPTADLISFRMIDNSEIIPPFYIRNIELGRFGISFCYKTTLFREGFKFKQSEQEDFDLINDIKNAKKKIIISPFVTYLVRNSRNISDERLSRVIIN